MVALVTATGRPRANLAVVCRNDLDEVLAWATGPPSESGPGALAAVVATLGFNFFFLPPIYTFTVEDPRNVAALFVFLVTGLLIGRLSASNRERLRIVDAERRDLARGLRRRPVG